jgi:hypothetical protein
MKQLLIKGKLLLLMSIFLSVTLSVSSQLMDGQRSIFFLKEFPSSSTTPLHEVATLGAPTTGAVIEGIVGSMKGCRRRFYCHSAYQTLGFLGPHTTAKPLSIKNQPGIFPAPLMGPASLTFNFHCPHSTASLTPIVVRPDGTIFHGLSLTKLNSPQSLVISSPAQTGIYTLFVLANQKDSHGVQVTVDAAVSTQPQQNKIFFLKSFELDPENLDLISAEFIYTPH